MAKERGERSRYHDKFKLFCNNFTSVATLQLASRVYDVKKVTGCLSIYVSAAKNLANCMTKLFIPYSEASCRSRDCYIYLGG